MLETSRDPNIAEQEIEAFLFYLTTLGYVDSEFDLREKAFVKKFLRQLVTARVDAEGVLDPELRFEQIERQREHYLQVFALIEAEVKALFTEAVAAGEDLRAFVLANLKLRCYERFERLSPHNREGLLALVDGFIAADGTVHPEERDFRNELAALLGSTPLPEAEAELAPPTLELAGPIQLPANGADHPLFRGFEHHYSADPTRIRGQIEADLRQLDRVAAIWAERREHGHGRLRGIERVSALAGEEFLDEYVHAVPQGGRGDFELIVLGDLHGCYSCLKGAIMQSGFMDKVRARRNDPEHQPDVRLVLLGDYIDRGRFGYNGVLRAVLKLFETVPEHVFVLRGNHEYYIEHGGRIYGGVSPADAIASLSRLLPDAVFERYLRFFEQMPNVLLFGNLLFVHGGIPRDETLAERSRDLTALNDPEIRFQMLWSDPSRAERVPADLQRASARFAFGRQQFRGFMQRIGCDLLVRGHEKVPAGFRVSYPRDEARLITLFSAGGATNDDLPEDSNYRDVRPMALTITRRSGETKVTPWAIDYRSYQDPDRNGFFRDPAELTA